MASLLAVSTTTALAGGNGATSSTQNIHGLVQTFPVTPICGSPSGTLTATINAVMHTTVNKAGDFWATSTEEAWFTIVPNDPSLSNYAGHFMIWFGASFNKNNAVILDNYNIKATATDGSGATLNIHLVDHMSISASVAFIFNRVVGRRSPVAGGRSPVAGRG